jgi:hypothetical protein
MSRDGLAGLSSSLSRCQPDLYSNIYTVRKHPDLKPNAVSSTPSLPKDTLQVSQEQLKKDALKRLRHTSKYVIFQSGFMRIGKYVFLAVTLPFYLTVYRIPKWLLVEGIPFILTVCTTTVQKVVERLKQRIEIIIQKMSRVLHQIQTVLRVLIQPIIRVALEIRNAIQRMRQSIFNAFKRIRKEKKSDKASLTLAKRLGNIFKATQQQFVRAKQWVINQAISLWNPIQQKLAKLSPQKLLAKGNNLALRLKEKPIFRQLLSKFHTAKHIAGKGTNWVFDKFTTWCQKGFTWIGQKVKAKYKQAISPILKRIQNKVKSFWLQLRDFLGNKRRQILDWLEKKQSNLKELNAEKVLTYLSAKLSFLRIPNSIKHLIASLFWSRPVKDALNLILKSVYSLFSFFSKGVNSFFHIIDVAFNFVSKALNHLIVFVSSFFKKGFAYLMNGFAFFGKFSRKLFYSLALFIVMAGILTVWGVQLLAQVSQDLIFLRMKKA